MSAIDDLLEAIFDGTRPALAAEFEGWLRGSRRFRGFAGDYRAKIRAKLRGARDDAGLQDVRAELEVAALLLADERFTLEYETYAAAKQRGPDFTATFRTRTRFNVEVRRMRRTELDGGSADTRRGRLMSILCDKVGQMPPSIVNVLWLIADSDVSPDDVAGAAAALRQQAERKAEDYFTRRGFDGAADFLKRFRQLSMIALPAEAGNAVWLNPLARHAAPPELVAAIRRLGVASG